MLQTGAGCIHSDTASCSHPTSHCNSNDNDYVDTPYLVCRLSARMDPALQEWLPWHLVYGHCQDLQGIMSSAYLKSLGGYKLMGNEAHDDPAHGIQEATHNTWPTALQLLEIAAALSHFAAAHTTNSIPHSNLIETGTNSRCPTTSWVAARISPADGAVPQCSPA